MFTFEYIAISAAVVLSVYYVLRHVLKSNATSLHYFALATIIFLFWTTWALAGIIANLGGSGITMRVPLWGFIYVLVIHIAVFEDTLYRMSRLLALETLKEEALFKVHRNVRRSEILELFTEQEVEKVTSNKQDEITNKDIVLRKGTTLKFIKLYKMILGEKESATVVQFAMEEEEKQKVNVSGLIVIEIDKLIGTFSPIRLVKTK